ncbi:DUF1630-domain-containing protein [Pholiota conissans]|uniref:DUF1630-domain-containing protein n=1 Tax=Pholiota conissans TaxID=109636 RepID=A0A9P5Z5X5_9AGAR|nr:DUF1630-domain-containing protein [Pholiota conissans]
MAPRYPTILNLEAPELEEDIGDLSPYLSLPSSTSSQASSSTSTFGASTSLAGLTDGELDDVIPIGSTLALDTLDTPTNTRFPRQLPSPSVPSLSNLPERPQQISRSTTVPETLHLKKESSRVHKVREELQALSRDPATVAKMRRWIMGIAVVEFDLDSGPVVEGIYPPLDLLPTELQNIAFCSFPDSMQFDQGSQTYSFRIREQSSTQLMPNRRPTEDGFIYGFSHFIQRRDSSSKRGYSQRSLVILTQYQYPALYSGVSNIIGPLFGEHGTPMLEAACHNIATWPDPTLGKTLELGFLGTVLHVEIPHSIDSQQVTATSSFNEKYDPKSHILAMSAPFTPPPILLFEACLPNLWSIWECLVLCEPILIFGTSPAQTSQAVWWLRDLLRPIPLAGDIRPYFTMQDSDHAQLVNKLPPKAGLLLGVTNPFFEKSCMHWPHILSLGRRIPAASPRQKSPSLGSSAGPAPGWKTRTHKRYISKDRVLLKQLELAIRGGDNARMDASLALRRHFCSRSTQLIAPLARYLNSLIPSPTEVHHARKATATLSTYTPIISSTSSLNSPAASPMSTYSSPAFKSSVSSTSLSSSSMPLHNAARGHSALRLKPFNTAHFFASLKAHGSTLPFKSTSKRTEFYERWLKSPAFGAWLAQQEQIVQTILNEAPASIVSTPPSRSATPATTPARA